MKQCTLTTTIIMTMVTTMNMPMTTLIPVLFIWVKSMVSVYKQPYKSSFRIRKSIELRALQPYLTNRCVRSFKLLASV